MQNSYKVANKSLIRSCSAVLLQQTFIEMAARNEFESKGAEVDIDEKVEDVTTVIDATLAAEKEHNEGVWHVMRNSPLVVFWCLFFAFSAVGWYVEPKHSCELLTSVRGFDAQVNGAMIGVPQFRLTFGLVVIDMSMETILD